MHNTGLGDSPVKQNMRCWRRDEGISLLTECESCPWVHYCKRWCRLKTGLGQGANELKGNDKK